MLLGTLGASLLDNLLAGGKGMIRTGEGKGIVRAGKGSKKKPKFFVTISSIKTSKHRVYSRDNLPKTIHSKELGSAVQKRSVYNKFR